MNENEFITIKTFGANVRGTVNRLKLRRMVEAGQIEARLDYSFDDMTGESSGTEWLPARVRTQLGHAPEHHGKEIVFHAHDFESSAGRAYVRTSEDGVVILRVHSNLIWHLRLRATS
jgi:hypothetical protein